MLCPARWRSERRWRRPSASGRAHQRETPARSPRRIAVSRPHCQRAQVSSVDDLASFNLVGQAGRLCTAIRAPEITHSKAQATAPTPTPTNDSLSRRTRWRWRPASRALTRSSPLSLCAGVMGAIADRTNSAARSTGTGTIPLFPSRSIGPLPSSKKPARSLSLAIQRVTSTTARAWARLTVDNEISMAVAISAKVIDSR